MRQRVIIVGLSAVLFLSGWGGVFASAMCRRAEASVPATGAGREPHACCRAETKESAASAESAPSHCPLSGVAAPETDAHTGSADDGHASSPASAAEGTRLSDGSPDACTYCFVRSENPPARFALPETHARKRADTPHAPRPGALSDAPPVASCAPANVSRGGAPPGASPPRHVLHSVFLI
jgi:hypothetical protein